MKDIRLSLKEINELAHNVLVHNGMSEPHAFAIAKVITAGQRDDCQSHGVYRLLTAVHTLRSGKVSGKVEPIVKDVSPSLVAVDAQHEFSQLSLERGSELAIEKARHTGIAALRINHCYHFAALWPEIEVFTDQGLAALAMTPSHAWVAPAGGSKPAFGTNPFAFGWPRKSKYPYVFDFATSAIARGEIELHRRAGKKIPIGWGIDSEGKDTDDPVSVINGGAMLGFGGYKGSALATMIELMAGPMIGDLTSLDSIELDANSGGTPCHGELILVFDPKMLGLGDSDADNARAERLFSTIVDQGARLPSQRRFAAREVSLREGAVIPHQLYEDVMALLK